MKYVSMSFMISLLLICGCQKEPEQEPEQIIDSAPSPIGAFYYDASGKGKHVADFREPDILRYEFMPLPGSGLDPLLKIYKWHVEDDLIITEETKTSNTRSVMKPQIFRFDTTGTLWGVGWTDEDGRHIDGPEEVDKSIRWYKKQ